MPRPKRPFIPKQTGFYHITTRVAGGALIFGTVEKEYFLKTLERFVSGFYIHLHAFAIMSNHIHFLVSEGTEEAKAASIEELLSRYHCVYGLDAEPPEGRVEMDGTVVADEDGGVERLRCRLMSISRFMQEYKQTCSRWYNKKHGRKGYLWGNRFGGTVVECGEAELACSAYIDLNPLRAGMVKVPEAYRWSGMGLRARSPKRSKQLITPLPFFTNHSVSRDDWYRLFVYRSGQLAISGKASISKHLVWEVEQVLGKLGWGVQARFRFRNFSEGLAIGSRNFVCHVQSLVKRKEYPPRQLTTALFCMQRLASP